MVNKIPPSVQQETLYYCHKPDCVNDGPFASPFEAIEHMWEHYSCHLGNAFSWKCTYCFATFVSTVAAESHMQSGEKHFPKFCQIVDYKRREDMQDFIVLLQKFIRLSPLHRDIDPTKDVAIPDRLAMTSGVEATFYCHYPKCLFPKKMGIFEAIEHLYYHLDYQKYLTTFTCKYCTGHFLFWHNGYEHMLATDHELLPYPTVGSFTSLYHLELKKSINTYLKEFKKKSAPNAHMGDSTHSNGNSKMGDATEEEKEIRHNG